MHPMRPYTQSLPRLLRTSFALAAGLAGVSLGLPGSALATPERPETPGLERPPLVLPEVSKGEGPPFEVPPVLGELQRHFEEVPPFQGPPEGVPPEPATPVGPDGEHPLGDVPPPRFERLLPPQQVPEPSTLAILGVGLGGLALFGSRGRGRPDPARG